MRTEELDYDLPSELIAQQPARVRSESRLLVLERENGKLTDSRFRDVGQFLQKGDCLVLNDTKVLPARFYERRMTGGKLEGLFVSQQNEHIWEVMFKGSRRVKRGERILLVDVEGGDFCEGQIVEKTGNGKCLLSVEQEQSVEDILRQIGFAPLPPYIKRDANQRQAVVDRERYQTVYAKEQGAIAAPTAGLHFTDELIGHLKECGIRFAYTTLHVGEGTFRPINTEMLEDFEIHEERFSIDRGNATIINDAKERSGRIVAVGTTSVRVLETVGESGRAKAASGATRLFIKSGYEFKMVDAMVTNFHLPRSTLLALVGAFAGLEQIKAAYRHAIAQRYRFYSYGDAMLIL